MHLCRNRLKKSLYIIMMTKGWVLIGSLICFIMIGSPVQALPPAVKLMMLNLLIIDHSKGA